MFQTFDMFMTANKNMMDTSKWKSHAKSAILRGSVGLCPGWRFPMRAHLRSTLDRTKMIWLVQNMQYQNSSPVYWDVHDASAMDHKADEQNHAPKNTYTSAKYRIDAAYTELQGFVYARHI